MRFRFLKRSVKAVSFTLSFIFCVLLMTGCFDTIVQNAVLTGTHTSERAEAEVREAIEAKYAGMDVDTGGFAVAEITREMASPGYMNAAEFRGYHIFYANGGYAFYSVDGGYMGDTFQVRQISAAFQEAVAREAGLPASCEVYSFFQNENAGLAKEMEDLRRGLFRSALTPQDDVFNYLSYEINPNYGYFVSLAMCGEGMSTEEFFSAMETVAARVDFTVTGALLTEEGYRTFVDFCEASYGISRTPAWPPQDYAYWPEVNLFDGGIDAYSLFELTQPTAVYEDSLLADRDPEFFTCTPAVSSEAIPGFELMAIVEGRTDGTADFELTPDCTIDELLAENDVFIGPADSADGPDVDYYYRRLLSDAVRVRYTGPGDVAVWLVVYTPSAAGYRDMVPAGESEALLYGVPGAMREYFEPIARLKDGQLMARVTVERVIGDTDYVATNEITLAMCSGEKLSY